MSEEIATGVWWLSGTRGCNVYLVRADDGSFVIIDAAFASSAAAIVREAGAIVGTAQVSHVLLTHHHGDHAGSALVVARALRARIGAGADDCEPHNEGLALRRHEPRRSPRALERLRRLLGRGESPDVIPVDDALSATMEIAPGIEVHSVPGHTPGGTCYIARRAGASFVGDLVIGHSDGLARSLAPANSDDAQYIDEMQRFAAIATDLGCPGHGYPSRGFPAELAELAATPREPWTLRNAPGRIRRLFAFARFLLRTRR